MAIRKYIEPGLDPTGVVCLTKADLLQMFQAAQPDTDIGFIIVSAPPPSIATYPALERFLWLCTTDGILRRHNGASWVPIISQATITPGSVTSAMLDVGLGTAYQVLAVAYDLSAVTFQSIANVIGAGITDVGAGLQLFLQRDGTVAKWRAIDFNAVANGSIPFTKLSSTGLGSNYLYVSNGTGGWTAVALPTSPTSLSNIQRTHLDAPNTGTVGQVLTVPSSGAGFEWTTPSTASTIPAALLAFTPTYSGNLGLGVGEKDTTVKIPYWAIVADPTSMIIGSVSAGDITLNSGTYLIDFVGIFKTNDSAGWQGEAGIYVGDSLRSAFLADSYGQQERITLPVKGLITLTAASKVSVQIHTTLGGTKPTRCVLGWARNSPTTPVAQCSILKVA